MKSYYRLISEADKEILKENSYSSASYLMLELCDQYNINLYEQIHDAADEKIATAFKEGVKRLKQAEPVAHILGYSYFYGRKFYVNENVLIPRNETEQLVMNTLIEIETYFNHYDLKVLDLATGSGAIGISLKLEEPNLDVTISDISALALEVANKNACYHQTNISLVKGDMLAPFKNKEFDVIVCNPPYINNQESLEKSVKDYEPSLALFGGNDGLDFYRQVLRESRGIIKTPGLIAFEIGYDQKERLEKLVKDFYPNKKYVFFKDYAGLDRMLFIYV